MNSTFCRSIVCLQRLISNQRTNDFVIRNYRVYHMPYLRELYSRRLKEGPVKPQPRSSQQNWDQDVELYAFTKRISEDLSRNGLLQTLTDKSYTQQIKSLASQSITYTDAISLTGSDNTEMSAEGYKISQKCIISFLREELPKLPKDGIEALTAFLLSTEKLSHIGKHLGLDDLVLTEEFPSSDEVISKAFLALVNLIHNEKGQESVDKFIKDFIITQLVGEDIDDIYYLGNAVPKLETLLHESGEAEPEFRLIGQLGADTVTSCYHVGVYSNKRLIGKAMGETVSVAQEMAARDALMTLYGIQDYRKPFNFSSKAKTQNDSLEQAQLS